MCSPLHYRFPETTQQHQTQTHDGYLIHHLHTFLHTGSGLYNPLQQSHIVSRPHILYNISTTLYSLQLYSISTSLQPLQHPSGTRGQGTNSRDPSTGIHRPKGHHRPAERTNQCMHFNWAPVPYAPLSGTRLIRFGPHPYTSLSFPHALNHSHDTGVHVQGVTESNGLAVQSRSPPPRWSTPSPPGHAWVGRPSSRATR